jgi:hypothetical protein
MITAVIAGALSMMIFTGRSPTSSTGTPHQSLALAFLTMVGTTLIIEAFHAHLPKGYLYCAMASPRRGAPAPAQAQRRQGEAPGGAPNRLKPEGRGFTGKLVFGRPSAIFGKVLSKHHQSTP